ncbi:MAG: hypothetical protein JXB08_04870 [Bacilli bacterium]|nr:hypothetical protein [Bacilli bacterium]
MIKIENDLHTKIGNIKRITMERNNLKVVLLSYGASIFSIEYKGKEMTLKPDNLEDFLSAKYYYGKTVGRTSGRLMCPSYYIDDKAYVIKPYPEDEITKLHGGKNGFSFQDFELVEHHEGENGTHVVLRYISQDQEEDYPGELTLYVTFQLCDCGELRLEFLANTTKDTICNITNHTYFNLASSGTILNHEMMIKATDYVVLDERLIPQRKETVTGKVFDLNNSDLLKNRIEVLKDTPILGYDHAFMLQKNDKRLKLNDLDSNVELTITTDYPAAVVFTHNLLFVDSFDSAYGNGMYAGVAVECQFEPYGIHFKDWNQAILRKGDIYSHFVSYQFK